MSSFGKNLWLWPPSGDLGEIMATVYGINPGFGDLDLRCVSTSPIPLLEQCRPGLKRRILLFAGGPTNLHPTSVDVVSKLYKDSSIALDVVNFYLEERCNFTVSGYHFGRSALDALVAATNVDGNSHIVHVLPESSIEHAINGLLEPSCKEKHHAAEDDDYAGPLGIEYVKACHPFEQI